MCFDVISEEMSEDKSCRSCGWSGMESCSSSRWWIDNKVVGCILVLAMLMIPSCKSLDDSNYDQPEVSFYYAVVNVTYTDPKTNKIRTDNYQGKYGVTSLVEQRLGLVVHVRTAKDNKTHGCYEYGNKLPAEKWVALVERGVCYFTEKIKMATIQHNASAAVIYNSEEKEKGVTVMQHSVDDQVSIFVARETGLAIAALVDAGVRVTMTITPGEKGSTNTGFGSPNSISKTSVLFVSISFIVLMIISLAWLVFYYIQRFRYAHAKERLARRLASAAKKAIAKIPQKTVKNGDRELDSEFDQCAVCIEVYKPHDVIRTLPCKHVFHKSCVDPWLLDQRSCPMCKLDILRAFGMQVFGSQESVHPDPESGAVAAPVEHEHSSTTDDQAAVDTEVKVLLLPHSCLHFHPGLDGAAETAARPVGVASGHEERQAGVSGVRHSASGDRLSRTSLSSLCAETQALMSNAHYEEEEEENGAEGFAERDHAALQEKQGVWNGLENVQLVVKLPEVGKSASESSAKEC